MSKRGVEGNGWKEVKINRRWRETHIFVHVKHALLCVILLLDGACAGAGICVKRA